MSKTVQSKKKFDTLMKNEDNWYSSLRKMDEDINVLKMQKKEVKKFEAAELRNGSMSLRNRSTNLCNFDNVQEM